MVDRTINARRSRSGPGRALRGVLVVALAAATAGLVGNGIQPAGAAAPMIMNDVSTPWNAAAGVDQNGVGDPNSQNFSLECTGGEGCSINGTDGAGGTNGGGIKAWLESGALTVNRAATETSELRVSLLVKHDPGDPITRLWIDNNYNATDDTGGAGFINMNAPPAEAYRRTYRTDKGSYDLLFWRGASGWTGTTPMGTGRGGAGDANRGFGTLRVRVGTATTTSTTATSTVFFVRGDSVNNDWPAMFRQGRINSPGRATNNSSSPPAVANDATTMLTGLSLAGDAGRRYFYNGDDVDGSGCDVFNGTDLRWRRLSDGVTLDVNDNGPENGNPNSGFTTSGEDNDGNSDRNYAQPATPNDRGRWVLEGVPIQENDCDTYRNPDRNPGNDDVPNRGWWQWIATVDVNTSLAPTVSSVTNSGTAVLANGSLTLTANLANTNGSPAEPTGRVQVVEWSGVDNVLNNADDFVSESNEPGGAAVVTTWNPPTNVAPGVKNFQVRATDNGAILAGDGVSRTGAALAGTYIVRNPTATAVSCTQNPPWNGSSTCTVTVNDTVVVGGGTVLTTPTGTVALSAVGDGTGSFTPCTLAQTVVGTATCTSSFTATRQDTYTVTATKANDNTHALSSASTTTKFRARATSTTVSCSPQSVAAGQPTTCTATVTDIQSGGTPSAPTGTVTFGQSGGGTFSSATCSLGAPSGNSASCSVSYTPSSSGSKTVNAIFNSDTSGLCCVAPTGGFRHASSSSTQFAVTATGQAGGRHPTSTSVSCSPPSVQLGSPTSCTATVTDTYTLGPTSTPTGTVTWGFSGGGSFSSPTCTLAVLVAGQSSSCSVNFTPSGSAGNKTVNAVYEGSALHRASSSGSVVVVATAPPNPPPPSNVRHPTSSAISCTPTTVPVGSPTTCTATVTDTFAGPHTEPTGTVTWGYSGGGSFSPTNSCALVGNGDGESSSCSVNFTPSGSPGNKTVNAVYNGTTAHKKSVTGSTVIVAT